MATTYEQLAYKNLPEGQQVYNPITGKAYGSQAELATDLGILPHQIDWTKIGTGMSAEDVGQGNLVIPQAQAYSPTNAVNFWQSTAAGLQSQIETYQKTLEASLKEQPTISTTDIISQQYEKWGVEGMFDQIKTWTNEANAVRENIATLQDQENQALLNAEGQRVSLATIKGRQSIIARQYDSKIAAEGARLSGYGAMIEATRGNLSMAQSFANEFVQAATYDYQVKRDTLQQFYNYNKDMFSYLGRQYESAIKNMVDAADKEYQEKYNEKQQVAQLLLEYPTAGIMATDTLEQALAKAQTPAAQKWNLEMKKLAESGITKPDYGALSELAQDINETIATDYAVKYKTREELIDALAFLYPELTKEQIGNRVYGILTDQREADIRGYKLGEEKPKKGIKIGEKLPSIDWKALGIEPGGIELTPTGEAVKTKEQWWK